jgi:membrane fusion protein, multidrug efflux system
VSRAAWIACALAGALAACAPPAEEAPETAPAPVAVRVAPVQRGEITAELTVGGETTALTTLRLASPVAGRITELSVQPGDHLAAGSVAARVLPLENEAALHGFGVLADAGALSPDERPLAQRLAREVGGRDVALRVPFAAVVADRLHSPGEQVAPNDDLLELFDPRSLVVIAQVPIDAIGDVHPGQPVDIHVAGGRATGQVAALLAAVTPQTLTVPVRIALSEPLQPPLLHAAAECRITIARHTEVLLLPRTALVSSGVEPQGAVMVAVGDHAQRRTVRLGLRNAEQVEMIEGVEPGELVLTEGGLALPDGAAIAPQP